MSDNSIDNLQRILVPLDGSNRSEQALRPAVAVAQRCGAELLLLRAVAYHQMSVYDPMGYAIAWPEEIATRMLTEAEDYLQDQQQRLVTRSLSVRTMVLTGDEAGVIVDTAAAEAVDLIVMAPHGRTGVGRWVFGSVTTRVLVEAACPVYITRSENPVTQVLITLDGSELAEYALGPGLALARCLDARVTLLRVERTGLLDSTEAALLEAAELGLGEHILENAYERAGTYLEQIARRQEDPLVEVAVLTGSPAQTILDYAGSESVDLIVMATHGRTGLRRWLYGSVTEKVLHGCTCSMLIVRPPAGALKDNVSEDNGEALSSA
jgi:nucleotide-binding universal stress UspA family protein